MLHIRIINTSSKAKAVQVVYYHNRKRIIFKHIGSAHTTEELDKLKIIAQDVIDNHLPLLPLYEEVKANNLLYLDKSEFLGVYYSFFHQTIRQLLLDMGFSSIQKELLLDLVVIRIFEPASKLRSIELLEEYFGIIHRRQSFYDSVVHWLSLKSTVERLSTEFARNRYSFNFDLLFYDVTTLYFETFKEDHLRQKGYSKDNKSQQPQILLALMVTKEGFPIAYDIFSGNTFEGHTMIPVINKFIDKHSVKDFTIIADAAMISMNNIKDLIKNELSYIVGARLGNLPMELIDQIYETLPKEDGAKIRLKTDYGWLICDYSHMRYRKDKYEMDKQIEKAKEAIESSSKRKRLKFTKAKNEKLTLNEELIEKTEKLLGIKGYFSNLDETLASNKTIIERYHDLYKIEQAFRISKSDLQIRPIYHFKEQPIYLHVLICFIALAISKHIEIITGYSIKKFITESKKITDARIINKITQKELRIRTKLHPLMSEMLLKLNLSH